MISNKTFIANSSNSGKITLDLVPASKIFVKTINGKKVVQIEQKALKKARKAK